MSKKVTVIGGGLAGSEAAWQLAEQFKQHSMDIKVHLYEMRPVRNTPAHHTDRLAELVCSNSLGSEFLTSSRGLLINEMQHFDSLIINSAIKSKVPAGQALAVDRELFGKLVTESIEQHPNISICREELTKIPEISDENLFTVIATGPLTSESLAEDIQRLLQNAVGIENTEQDAAFLNFFDAASPILSVDSVDFDIAFKGSRYNKSGFDRVSGADSEDEGDYINCPFYEQAEYDAFYRELINAEKAPQKDFEKGKYFEACLPVEVIASRGEKTLCFGPLKPVGLEDPRHPGRKAIAVVQLRQDNVIGSLYNMVGFQTNLKWTEQKRVFSMIPGLQNMDIVRYGVMHQNIYINSPKFLERTMNMRTQANIYFAGQITGVEGYTESAATGIVVARDIVARITKQNPFVLPEETMLGALTNYISNADAKRFQPMNSNWGLVNINMDDVEKKIRKDKKRRNEMLVQRSLELLKSFKLLAIPN